MSLSRAVTPTEFEARHRFIWLTLFGNSAIVLDLGTAAGAISAAVDADMSTALFKFLSPPAGTTIRRCGSACSGP